MKEAFWGILIVMLGLVGIVIVNIFQNVTIGNDQTYYLLKESAEAASYDAIDLAYYRLNGDLRMVEDKFVENFTRRFAQNIGNNGNYYISVQEITGNPPRISIKVSTGITSLQGDDFGIVNRIDGIMESKYKIGEITSFLGITEEEWLARTNNNNEKDNACNITTYGSEELECITGDLEFTGWGEEKIPQTVCNAGSFGVEKRDANYKVCECGKWKEESEEVTTTPVISGTEYIYNWVFKKDGELRDIDEKTITRAYVETCTDSIQIYIPNNLKEKEPSTDNSKYVICPASGTTVNLGQTSALHINYIPTDSSNRKIDWSIPKDDKTITFYVNNPITDKGYSKAYITGEELGTTTITAKSTNDKTATCKITVLDGYADSVSCADKTIKVGDEETMKGGYLPETATNTKLTWSISDSSVASIKEDTGVVKGKKVGNVTVTVKSKNLYDNTEVSSTCSLKVNSAGGGGVGGGGDCVCKYVKEEEVDGPWSTCAYTEKVCSKCQCFPYGCYDKYRCVAGYTTITITTTTYPEGNTVVEYKGKELLGTLKARTYCNAPPTTCDYTIWVLV